MFVLCFYFPWDSKKSLFVCPVYFHSNIQLFSQQTFSFKRRKEQMTEHNKKLSVREAIWNFEGPQCFSPNGLNVYWGQS